MVFFDKLLDFFSSKRKRNIVLANNDAIEKMKEMEKNIIRGELNLIQKQIKELDTKVETLITLAKDNQEFIVYCCTIIEELNNFFIKGTAQVEEYNEDEKRLIELEEEENEMINSLWTKKEDKVSN